MKSASLSDLLRTLFVLALLFILPLLAMPQVLRRIDALLEPEPHSTSDRKAAASQPATSGVSYHLISQDNPIPPPQAQDFSDTSNYTRTDLPTATSFDPSETVVLRQPALDDADWFDRPEEDPIQSIHLRLKNLGANYVALERTNDPRKPYRFYCTMGVAGSSVYGRSFEARGVDPLQTMRDVLSDVEMWNAAAEPPRLHLQNGGTALR